VTTSIFKGAKKLDGTNSDHSCQASEAHGTFLNQIKIVSLVMSLVLLRGAERPPTRRPAPHRGIESSGSAHIRHS
jgi:hypothetical protein